jgi:hypothetical protein
MVDNPQTIIIKITKKLDPEGSVYQPACLF